MIILGKQEKDVTDVRIASYGILLNNEGKMAVVKHKNWGLIFPGGKKEKDENGVETIKREVLEEIGYETSEFQFFETVEAFYDIIAKGQNYYCHLIADIYIGKILDKIQDPIESDTSLEWYSPCDLIDKLKLDYQNKILNIILEKDLM